MREILFRGRRCDGVWEEGYLISGQCVITERWITAIVTLDTQIFPHCEVAYEEVDPVTVGQFIGLIDKDGKKIFEGDILEAHYDDRFPENATRTVVVWKDGYEDLGSGWYIEQKPYAADPLDGYDASRNKVIGNVHDNPELVEGMLL